MPTFAEIVKESEATRHETYMLGFTSKDVDEKGNRHYKEIIIGKAPTPEQEAREAEKTGKQLRAAERQQRAERLAQAYALCNTEEPDISSLIEEPEWIDSDQERLMGAARLMNRLITPIE